jgi:hypothetical protein
MAVNFLTYSLFEFNYTIMQCIEIITKLRIIFDTVIEYFCRYYLLQIFFFNISYLAKISKNIIIKNLMKLEFYLLRLVPNDKFFLVLLCYSERQHNLKFTHFVKEFKSVTKTI